MMPAPCCPNGVIGLKRVRSKAVLLGERHYRCGDCSTLWRCSETALDKMVPALPTLETSGETVTRALPPPVRRLVGADRGRP